MRRTTFIDFELWCSWTGDAPVYRLYLDNELLVERTYVWQNPGRKIRERVPAHLDAGAHFIKIENLSPAHANFYIKDFRINDGEFVYRPTDGRFVLNAIHVN